MPATFALYQILLLVLTFAPNDSEDFSDLGRQLLAGFVIAVVVAVAFTIIKLRIQEKRPPARIVSIISSDDDGS